MDVLGVAQCAVNRVREQIITGRLPPGSRLKEIELSESLGISRCPLREALRILGNEKLLEFRPRRGTFVAAMSLEDWDQACSVRQMIESAAIDSLAEKGRRSFDALREACDQHALDGESTVDRQNALSLFHTRLIEACANRWLANCHQCLRSSLARYHLMYLGIPGSTEHSAAEHRRILLSLEEGDFAQAKHDLTDHLERVRLAVRSAIELRHGRG